MSEKEIEFEREGIEEKEKWVRGALGSRQTRTSSEQDRLNGITLHTSAAANNVTFFLISLLS